MGQANGYNGWDNYETWLVNLWISNGPWSDSFARELVQVKDDHVAADLLKEWISGDAFPLKEPSLFSDLLTAALSEVNWLEVAKAFREE